MGYLTKLFRTVVLFRLLPTRDFGVTTIAMRQSPYANTIRNVLRRLSSCCRRARQDGGHSLDEAVELKYVFKP